VQRNIIEVLISINMMQEWTLRRKQLLFYYFQEIRARGKFANDTSKTSLYRCAARKAGYGAWTSAAMAIRKMLKDSNVVRYIDNVGSVEEIE
jgi:hypothetical protein